MAGLYLHVPFRLRRRPYDDAYAVGVPSSYAPYAQAVCDEVALRAPRYARAEPFRSLYVGGGRPSLLPLEDLHTITAALIDTFDFAELAEVTFEVSPSDATQDYLRGLFSQGVRRLSLPVMAFFPEELAHMQAPHAAGDVVHAIRTARQVGFRSLSVDLAFGWAQQSADHWKAALGRVVELGVEHVALHETAAPTYSPVDTRELLARKVARFYKYAMRHLRRAGYEQYEIAHFARPGHRAHYNRRLHDHGNVLGLGPSAHAFWWTDRDAGGRAQRWTNVADLKAYVIDVNEGRLPLAQSEVVSRRALAAERVFDRLRTAEGLDLAELTARYGFDLRAQKAEVLARLEANGYIAPLDETDGTVRLTDRGKLVCDAIVQYLVPDATSTIT
jgi:oxygen-independent coproporphyrinogen-3 oxidase